MIHKCPFSLISNREHCLAVKELYCHKEWVVLESTSSVQSGLFGSVSGHPSPSLHLPNCLALPSLTLDPDACTHVPFVGKRERITSWRRIIDKSKINDWFYRKTVMLDRGTTRTHCFKAVTFGVLVKCNVYVLINAFFFEFQTSRGRKSQVSNSFKPKIIQNTSVLSVWVILKLFCIVCLKNDANLCPCNSILLQRQRALLPGRRERDQIRDTMSAVEPTGTLVTWIIMNVTVVTYQTVYL